jgi:hypothetical protein
MIDEALGQEESELLRTVSGRPNIVERTLGIYGAGAGWTIALMMVAQTAMFVAGVWATWNFFEAAEPVAQLRWGLPGAVLLLMSLILKLAVTPTVQHNRVMRELKRLELQIARMRS